MAELTLRREYRVRVDSFDYLRACKWDHVVPIHKLADAITRQCDTMNRKGPHMGILYLVRDDQSGHYWCSIEIVAAFDLKVLESIQYLVEETAWEVDE
jgi:hypothetical protein